MATGVIAHRRSVTVTLSSSAQAWQNCNLASCGPICIWSCDDVIQLHDWKVFVHYASYSNSARMGALIRLN